MRAQFEFHAFDASGAGVALVDKRAICRGLLDLDVVPLDQIYIGLIIEYATE
jgi:hypothetical protein